MSRDNSLLQMFRPSVQGTSYCKTQFKMSLIISDLIKALHRFQLITLSERKIQESLNTTVDIWVSYSNITSHRVIQGFPKTFHSFFERSSSGTWFFLSLDETEEDFKNSRVFPAVKSQKPDKSKLIAEQHLYVVKSDYYSVFLMATRVRSKTSLDDERSFVQRQIKVCDRYLTRILSPHFKTYKQITHAIKDYNTEDNY